MCTSSDLESARQDDFFGGIQVFSELKLVCFVLLGYPDPTLSLIRVHTTILYYLEIRKQIKFLSPIFLGLQVESTCFLKYLGNTLSSYLPIFTRAIFVT